MSADRSQVSCNAHMTALTPICLTFAHISILQSGVLTECADSRPCRIALPRAYIQVLMLAFHSYPRRCLPGMMRFANCQARNHELVAALPYDKQDILRDTARIWQVHAASSVPTCIGLVCFGKCVAVNYWQGVLLPPLLIEAALEHIQKFHS